MIGTGVSIPGEHNVPSSINIIVGTPTGTVADIQSWADGNVLQIAEVAATPGMDLEMLFTNVKSIRRIGLSMYYDGSSTHWIEIQIWNYTEAAWKTIWTFSKDGGLNYRYSDLSAGSDDDYIDASGNAKLKMVHPTAGNAAHDAFIGYAALIR